MRRLLISLALAMLGSLALSASAQAAFGLSEFDVTFTEADGSTVTQAGAHPFAMTTSVHFNSTQTGEGGETIEEAVKDFILTQMPGFVGNPSAVPRCSTAEFLNSVFIKTSSGELKVPTCPDSAAIGFASVRLANKAAAGSFYGAIYNLEPPPGVAAKVGFWLNSFPVALEFGVKETPPYNVVGGPTNVAQVLEVTAFKATLWGTPALPAHDSLRGHCLDPIAGGSLGTCKASVSPDPFITLPRACTGPLQTGYEIDSWQNPGVFVKGFVETHDSAGNPTGMSGCGKLEFGPEVSVQPTTTSAESPSGLDVSIDVADEGLHNADGIANADMEATRLAFPPGVTLNPSAAEGLGTCSKAQFQAAGLEVKGCPEASKLGSLEVETPILKDHTLHGSFYLAQPDDPSSTEPGAENPFDSLFAAYLVIRDPERGVFVKLPVRIETDEASGQIVTVVKEMPPVPLSFVRVHLRAGARAPLVTPPSCGTYATTATLTPSSGAAPTVAGSKFKITSGPGGGPCPPAGISPFDPGFEAGSANSAASFFSPFSMRLTRADGEQDLTRFSAVLPPGVVPKLAGLAKCSDSQIAAAENKNRTGRQEQAHPSCPASSQVGHVLAGAGVGTALTYVPGSLYLAGPYHGDPLSVVAIVPAVAGPFDAGTVVTRVALNLNPVTYRGEVDGSNSDPIPHILKGIPLKLRDLRVYADRPDFTLNPTSCEPFQTAAQIFGSFADPFNPADDVPVARASRYQAASCASLAFNPKLSLSLKGGTKRDKNPALHSTITYPYPSGPGYANIGKAVVTLPPSEFIDPEHINNPCTRVQFNANQCPASSILGSAKAISPLLDEPLEGPVIFRSNGGERKLPDVVIALHGLVDITLVGAVDTATPKSSPRIRTTFSSVPDAPVSSFTLDLYGGKRGLLVNNRNLCRHKLKARVDLTGQNGRARSSTSVLSTSCRAKKSARRARRSP